MTPPPGIHEVRLARDVSPEADTDVLLVADTPALVRTAIEWGLLRYPDWTIERGYSTYRKPDPRRGGPGEGRVSVLDTTWLRRSPLFCASLRDDLVRCGQPVQEALYSAECMTARQRTVAVVASYGGLRTLTSDLLRGAARDKVVGRAICHMRWAKTGVYPRGWRTTLAESPPAVRLDMARRLARVV